MIYYIRFGIYNDLFGISTPGILTTSFRIAVATSPRREVLAGCNTMMFRESVC